MLPAKNSSAMNLAATLCGFAAVLYLCGRSVLTGLLQAGLFLFGVVALPQNMASVAQMFINIVAMALPFGLLKILPQQQKILQKMQRKKELWGGLFLLFWAFSLVGNLLSGALSRLEQGLPDRILLPSDGAGLALAWLAVCLVPAVGEELLFRGLIQGWLRPYGAFSAVLGQAVLFALLHGRVSACVSALLGGIALGLVAQTSGSLHLGVAFHLYNNTVAFVGKYTQQYSSDLNFLYYVLWLGAPLMALFCLLTARIKGDNPNPDRIAPQRFWPAKAPAWAISVAMLFCYCVWQTLNG